MTPMALRLTLAVILAAAAYTRLADLGSRFFDHDEAVHASLSHHLATRGEYRYHPEYHGPLLYHLEAAVFRLAGAGDLQARIPSAIAGVLLIALLFRLLLASFGVHVALAASGLAVLSPTLTYYSRFNNHDALVAVLTLVLVASALQATRGGIVWFGAALGLALVVKLNGVMVAVTMIGYGMGYALVRSAAGHPVALGSWLRQRAGAVAVASMLCVVIVGLLSITTLMHYRAAGESLSGAVSTTVSSVLLDGIVYWWNAHQAARLGGPFYYYVPLLVIYEPLIVIGGVSALLFALRRRRWPDGSRHALGGWLFVAITQTALYAYANEKVPWLAVHIVLPWLVVTAVVLVEMWQRWSASRARVAIVLVVAGFAVVTGRANLVVNTVNRSNAIEPLLHRPYASAVRETVDLIQRTAGRHPDEPVAVIEPWVQWPFAWYLRDLPLIARSGRLQLDESAPVLLAADTPVEPQMLERHEVRRLDYYKSSTWLEQFERGDLRGMFRFIGLHDRWAPEQRSAFVLWVRKERSNAPP